MDEKLLSAQEELLKRFGSLYEAIAVLSQRARQIGKNQLEAIQSLQKQYATTDISRENLLEDEFDLSEPRDPIELPKFPKPTVAAIHEALRDDISWEYSQPTPPAPEPEAPEPAKPVRSTRSRKNAAGD